MSNTKEEKKEEKLTPHFSIDELTWTSVKKFQKKNSQVELGKLYMLAGFAERIREIVGQPLIVSSGYRCPELNKYLGGVSTSQHCLCEALDIICKKMSVREMFDKINKSDLKYDQMIIEVNKSGDMWLHISIGSKKQKLLYKNGTYEKI